MNKKLSLLLITITILTIVISLPSCKKEANEVLPTYAIIDSVFKGAINLNALENYAQQTIPNYITKDNTAANPITNKGATLGRVLFYDNKLSINNTISCGSCHKQNFAFSDTAVASRGVNGLTSRHSMRLANARFGSETRFFWDERAITLENQTTQPIKDHTEMGFSGQSGNPTFNNLITKLSNINYYKELFKFVYGTEEITEIKIQNALAQFIRSIQSFDSKYDAGRSQANNDLTNFTNFTAQENEGKNLFMGRPSFDANSVRIGGGLGCNACHRAPEFDIDPNSRSNGIGGSIGGGADFTNTKSPSLRNLTNAAGVLNGPMMHTALIKDLQSAIGHYGDLTAAAISNPNLDNRLKPNGTRGQQLQLNAQEVNAVIAFIKTLSGTDVYTNKKWSSPF